MGKQTGETFKVRDFPANHKRRSCVEDIVVIQSPITKSRLTRWLLAASSALGLAVAGLTADMLPANLSKTPISPTWGRGDPYFSDLLLSFCCERQPMGWCDEGNGEYGTECILVPTNTFKCWLWQWWRQRPLLRQEQQIRDTWFYVKKKLFNKHIA